MSRPPPLLVALLAAALLTNACCEEETGGPPAPDTSPDAAVDAAPEPDVPPPPPPWAAPLAAEAAEPSGSHEVLEAGRVLLDPGAALTWSVPPPPAARPDAAVLWVRARVWRFEDGRLRVSWQGEDHEAQLFGDARARPALARVPVEADEDPGWGPSWRPRPLDLPWPDRAAPLRLEARGGSVEVLEAWLASPDWAAPEPTPAATPEPTLRLSPCHVASEEVGCDDAPWIEGQVEAAPEGPVVVALAPERFTLRSTLEVRRAGVSLLGTAEEGRRTELLWSPAGDGAGSAAIRFAGGGRSEAVAPAVGAVEAGLLLGGRETTWEDNVFCPEAP